MPSQPDSLTPFLSEHDIEQSLAEEFSRPFTYTVEDHQQDFRNGSGRVTGKKLIISTTDDAGKSVRISRDYGQWLETNAQKVVVSIVSYDTSGKKHGSEVRVSDPISRRAAITNWEHGKKNGLSLRCRGVESGNLNAERAREALVSGKAMEFGLILTQKDLWDDGVLVSTTELDERGRVIVSDSQKSDYPIDYLRPARKSVYVRPARGEMVTTLEHLDISELALAKVELFDVVSRSMIRLTFDEETQRLTEWQELPFVPDPQAVELSVIAAANVMIVYFPLEVEAGEPRETEKYTYTVPADFDLFSAVVEGTDLTKKQRIALITNDFASGHPKAFLQDELPKLEQAGLIEVREFTHLRSQSGAIEHTVSMCQVVEKQSGRSLEVYSTFPQSENSCLAVEYNLGEHTLTAEELREGRFEMFPRSSKTVFSQEGLPTKQIEYNAEGEVVQVSSRLPYVQVEPGDNFQGLQYERSVDEYGRPKDLIAFLESGVERTHLELLLAPGEQELTLRVSTGDVRARLEITWTGSSYLTTWSVPNNVDADSLSDAEALGAVTDHSAERTPTEEELRYLWQRELQDLYTILNGGPSPDQVELYECVARQNSEVAEELLSELAQILIDMKGRLDPNAAADDADETL